MLRFTLVYAPKIYERKSPGIGRKFKCLTQATPLGSADKAGLKEENGYSYHQESRTSAPSMNYFPLELLFLKTSKSIRVRLRAILILLTIA